MSGRTDVAAWPLQPLLDVAQVSAGQLAELAGYNPRSGHRWVLAGLVSDEVADRAAVALDLHPAVIWPDW